ncbi:MAG: PTS transporter subunit EIIC [Solobacterium sp.]|nr:PTS transporter subunit EIIC [Solobacterium sp.]
MNSISNFLKERIEPTAQKFANSDFIRIISSAFTMLMGVLIGGAFFALVSSLNIGPYQTLLTNLGVKPFLAVVEKFSSGMMGVYVAFATGYSYMNIKGYAKDAIGAGFVSIISFLVMTPLAVIEETSYMAFDYLGSAGIFTAIITGFIVGSVYRFCIEKNIKITMPAGTPPMVSNAFTAVIPSLLAILVAVILNGLSVTLLHTSATEFLYNLIGTPFSKFTGSVFTIVFFVFCMSVFWLFGIHGGQIFTPFILMLYLQNGIANQQAFASGGTPTNILTFSFFLLTLCGGNGGTLGLNLDMLLFSKSERYKTLGKLAIAPSLCGINEPLLFGLPIVMNPFIAIPFILVPVINVLVAYFTMSIGLVSVPRIATTVMGTPVFMDGFLVCGISGLLLQVVMVAISAVMYLPFFKSLDAKAVAEETSAEAE